KKDVVNQCGNTSKNSCRICDNSLVFRTIHSRFSIRLSSIYSKKKSIISGTSGRSRTATPAKEPDFESGVSTNFTTLAQGEHYSYGFIGVNDSSIWMLF